MLKIRTILFKNLSYTNAE